MKHHTLTWSEAIEEVMLQNNYCSTLKKLYQLAPQYKPDSIGLTPNRTIDERVQRDARFTRIGPGFYALTAYLDKLPDEYNPHIEKTIVEQNAITHSFVQGMLLEIGQLKGFGTYSPDKNLRYIDKKLSDYITIDQFPQFTYDKILQSSKFIDVIWFNKRHFPQRIFEVENSTNFRNSLVKFVELQDFNVSMNIIIPNDKNKKDKFNQEIEKIEFADIRSRVKCYTYDYIEGLYASQIASKQYADFFDN